MQIQNIFAKDLFRPINGVVKADQKDEAVVWQELDEYVITKELDRYLRQFFQAYLDAIDNPNDPVLTSRMGVWVSGFFGSGKSHFIKILSYLLENRVTDNPESDEQRHAIDFFDAKINDPMLLADLKRAVNGDTDVVLFNIDSKADSKDGRDAILQVFFRVFNEMQGFCGEAPHIAEMERYLSSKGVLTSFKHSFKENHGGQWEEERDAYSFLHDEIVDALAKALGMSREAAVDWYEKAEERFSLSIEKFAKLVNEYLETKNPNHRVVFLVDEIGQFIGSDTHLMLNLQTITEDLGRICKGRAWVVVTSQEDINAILGEFRAAKSQDFSKIQGRFNTRLSLSSSNTDEVIQRRLLAKTEAAKVALEDLFQEKGEILKNQISFTGGATLKKFTDDRNFIANYPFSPYQFELLQKVFESIRKAGATGLHLAMGERSMLDAFQHAAKSIAERKIGALVPLYAFYPAIESFLDTAIKRTVDHAKDNSGLEAFDVELLRALFLIRYVDLIKPNVDNLVTLCIDEADTDRLILKRQIEESLQRLEKETLINRNGDLYFFLTNEERDISREIKNTDISGSEENKLLSEILFDDVLKAQNKHRYLPNKQDYGFNRICDGRVHGTKADQDLAVEVISPLLEDYELFSQSKCIGHSLEGGGRVIFKLGNPKELVGEIRIYLQTEKYIRLKNTDSAPTTLKRILSERADENRARRERLVLLLDQLLVEGDSYALGQSLELKGSSSANALAEGLNYLIQNLFTKLSYLKGLTDDPIKEIRATLMADDIGQGQLGMKGTESNPLAYAEVRQYVDLCSAKNHKILLDEVVNKFSRRPYGWPEWEAVMLVARLFMAGEITLKAGDAIQPKEAIDYLTKSVKWKQVTIIKRKTTSTTDLSKARKLGQDLFGSIGPDAEDALYQFIQNKLEGWRTSLFKYSTLADTGKYPGGREANDGLEEIKKLTQIVDTYEFFQIFNKRKDDFLDLAEDVNQLKDFFEKQRPTWDRLQDKYHVFSQNKTDLVKDQGANKALDRMAEILKAASPYGMLQETDKLIETISSINNRLIKEKQTYVQSEIDKGIAQVKDSLNNYQAGSDLSNTCLKPLQDIKKAIENETSIPSIAYQLSQLGETLDSSMEQLEATSTECVQEEGGETPPPPKTIKYISPAKYSPKYFLESPDDIDTYIERLKEELLAALEGNSRIRIK
jgi:hypothetical protein